MPNTPECSSGAFPLPRDWELRRMLICSDDSCSAWTWFHLENAEGAGSLQRNCEHVYEQEFSHYLTDWTLPVFSRLSFSCFFFSLSLLSLQPLISFCLSFGGFWCFSTCCKVAKKQNNHTYPITSFSVAWEIIRANSLHFVELPGHNFIDHFIRLNYNIDHVCWSVRTGGRSRAALLNFPSVSERDHQKTKMLWTDFIWALKNFQKSWVSDVVECVVLVWLYDVKQCYRGFYNFSMSLLEVHQPKIST